MKNYYILLVTLLISFTINAQNIEFPDANFKNRLTGYNVVDNDGDGDTDNSADINDDGEIDINEALAVTMIDVSPFAGWPEIVSLEGIQYFTNLISLDCSGNNIPSLNFTGLSSLETLICWGNPLGSIDLSTLENLKNLNVGACNLSTLDLSSQTNLETLNYFSNQLPTLDLSNQLNLLRLTCTNNNVPNLDFLSDLNQLEVLNCGNNLLTSLDISNFANLEDLDCNNNQLTTLDLIDLPNLHYLSCRNNNLTSLNLSVPNLNALICDNNELTTLDLSDTRVVDLSAYNNQITYLNVKNGVNFFPPETFTNIQNNPMEVICADPGEPIPIYGDEIVTSYCTFAPGGNVYTLEGSVSIDLDSNGCDTNDVLFPNFNFTISNVSEFGNFVSNSSGDYFIPVGNGMHTITPSLENPSYYSVTPTSLVVDFPTDVSPFLQDFCITPNGVFNDLEITIIPIQLARPGFNTNYRLIYKNKGTTALSGSVDLTFQDDLMDFVSASPTEDAQSANLLTWNFTDLEPFESRNIDFTMTINSPMDTPPVNGDDVLEFIATLHTSETDETPDDNTFELNQTVVNSYDPNDKTCLEGDFITPEMVGEYVHYMIRFENTGTASAVNVVVKDNIDRTKYDLSTLVPLHASHDYVARIKDNATQYYVEFIFENINLAFDDANNDGYVVFKIKTLDTLALNDTFENNAEIYFDFNFPIITNVAQTTIATLSTEEFELANKTVSLYPNPTTHNITLESKQAIKHITIYDISGRLINEITVIGLKTELIISTEALSTGSYFVKIKTETSEIVKKVIKE